MPPEQAPVTCGEFTRFLHQCERQHTRLDEQLQSINTKLDELIKPVVTKVEDVDRTIWWQRIILGLCVALVSVHPVGQFITNMFRKIHP